MTLAAAWFVPTGWLVVAQGRTLRLLDQVTIGPSAAIVAPAATLAPGGDVLLLTVEARDANIYLLASAALGLAGPRMLLRRSQVIPPGLDDEEYLRLSRDQMDESIGLGSVLGAEAAGLTASAHGEGARVVSAQASSASSEASLVPGDLILAVDGDPVYLQGDIGRLLRGKRAGQTANLTVLRGGAVVEVQSILAPAPEGAEELMLGVTLRTELPRFALPAPISVETTGISGPSGGLAIALAVYQRLAGEDLLRGQLVAASGSVRADGTVGPVGGAGLKAISAGSAGATVLFVAAANVAEVRQAAPGLIVVGVTNFGEVLTYLRTASLTPAK